MLPYTLSCSALTRSACPNSTALWTSPIMLLKSRHCMDVLQLHLHFVQDWP